MELILERTYYATGTNGVLHVDGKEFCNTIELPWENNKRKISCIPEGRYSIVKRVSRKFGQHLLIEGVPGRDLILIHPANNALKELNGCIAPVTTLQGPGIGLRSRIPFEALRKIVYTTLDKKIDVFITIKKK